MLNLSQNGCSVWVASSTEELLTPTAVALGKFDGVHLGHQRVIQPVLQSAWSQENSVRPYSTVVTFDPHPQEFFTGLPRDLLTPLDEKVAQLRSLGVEQLVLLPFDRELSALSPEEFVDKILVQQLQCQQISVGQDFCFGKKRVGTAQDLQAIAAKYNIPVTIVPIKTDTDILPATDDARISTSLIRESLEAGDIPKANRLLGRPYTLTGEVVTGQKLGRTIGFPTANIQLPKDKFLPRHGVYAIEAIIHKETPDKSPTQQFGVMNIGNRPTVNGIDTCVEVHLFNWYGDLYGKILEIQLVKFLRPEQKFPSLEALKNQIQLDCTAAKAIFSC
ncbi:bifunctional riboflavin kinase/FAD synthetase [Dolichospermum sp. LEGE 00240]|uniref:bifunctional riboflavin kinase/FAD synthetase n=1 Tax=Dolichospermum sp. LEGE 00240 TaxID=1828603 RepID=UPI001882F5E1|nr:bifunctional riboflavin kinase/FAD synthetase [Dolichospermum sp. LEGE 00240]MDM3847819.1 bifunctional riboflavin kinase/FAD synthetase [Aphanizomenon gracile PMC638.10]MDM3850050.1 bifunctional riboflavin kinase/FAD synthetase [Aphanizomenon gracile PMC627.10]